MSSVLISFQCKLSVIRTIHDVETFPHVSVCAVVLVAAVIVVVTVVFVILYFRSSAKTQKSPKTQLKV